jgi:hypothetical protein
MVKLLKNNKNFFYSARMLILYQKLRVSSQINFQSLVIAPLAWYSLLLADKNSKMSSLDFAASIPPWLDQELFNKAIQSFKSDPQAKVTNFVIKAATQPGENFASAVFRAIVKFTTKHSKDEQEMSVIIKTQPVSVDLPGMDHMKDTTLFETEISAYTEVLMKIQDLITGAGYEDVICPK